MRNHNKHKPKKADAKPPTFLSHRRRRKIAAKQI